METHMSNSSSYKEESQLKIESSAICNMPSEDKCHKFP